MRPNDEIQINETLARLEMCQIGTLRRVFWRRWRDLLLEYGAGIGWRYGRKDRPVRVSERARSWVVVEGTAEMRLAMFDGG